MTGAWFVTEDNHVEVAEALGYTVEEVRKAFEAATKRLEVLYVGKEELMPIKSWMCDGVKRRPGCKETTTPHSRHSIWENAK